MVIHGAEKTYRGARLPEGGVNVGVFWTDDAGGRRARTLPPRNDLWNHSPDGFEWGYSGSGPAQLGLAILADATGEDEVAVREHQRFKAAFIVPLPQSEPWEIKASVVLAWLRASGMAVAL